MKQMVALDISSLEKAINSFEKGWIRFQADPADLEVRDACIQRFEYTYELGAKMIHRRLEMDSDNPAEIDLLNFRDKIRLAAEKGIIYDPENWFEFRDKRNRTAHTYAEKEAKLIELVFPLFLASVKQLVSTLSARNAN